MGTESTKWIKVTDSFPPPFALCILRDAKERMTQGWWSGSTWDAGDLGSIGEVVAWKRANKP